MNLNRIFTWHHNHNSLTIQDDSPEFLESVRVFCRTMNYPFKDDKDWRTGVSDKLKITCNNRDEYLTLKSLYEALKTFRDELKKDTEKAEQQDGSSN